MSVEINFKMTRSSRRAMLAAIGLIAAMGLYRWILWPYSAQLFAARQYEAILDKSIHKTASLCQAIEQKKAKTEQLSKDADQLRNELFTIEESHTFFASIAGIAASAGCVVQSVSLPSNQDSSGEQTDNKSQVVTKKAVVAVAGGYNGIVKFLDSIASWQRRVWIESVNIDVDGNTGKLKCRATLTLYCVEPVESF